MNAADFERAEDLLRDPDAEDCERFASRYGRDLLDTARAFSEMVEALVDLEGLLSKVAPEYAESPMAANARAAIAKATGL